MGNITGSISTKWEQYYKNSDKYSEKLGNKQGI